MDTSHSKILEIEAHIDVLNEKKQSAHLAQDISPIEAEMRRSKLNYDKKKTTDTFTREDLVRIKERLKQNSNIPTKHITLEEMSKKQLNTLQFKVLGFLIPSKMYNNWFNHNLIVASLKNKKFSDVFRLLATDNSLTSKLHKKVNDSIYAFFNSTAIADKETVYETLNQLIGDKVAISYEHLTAFLTSSTGKDFLHFGSREYHKSTDKNIYLSSASESVKSEKYLHLNNYFAYHLASYDKNPHVSNDLREHLFFSYQLIHSHLAKLAHSFKQNIRNEHHVLEKNSHALVAYNTYNIYPLLSYINNIHYRHNSALTFSEETTYQFLETVEQFREEFYYNHSLQKEYNSTITLLEKIIPIIKTNISLFSLLKFDKDNIQLPLSNSVDNFTNSINSNIQKNTFIENSYSSDVQQQLKNIDEYYLKIKQSSSSLNEIENHDFEKIFQEKLPTILQNYHSIAEEYRHTLTGVQGKTAEQLVVQSLSDIEVTLVHMFEAINLEKLKKLSINQRHMSTIKDNYSSATSIKNKIHEEVVLEIELGDTSENTQHKIKKNIF